MSDRSSRQSPLGEQSATEPRRYDDSVVGFLDTLAATALSGSLDFLNALASTATQEQRITASWPSGRALGLRTTWFSDNLGVSVPLGAKIDPDDITFSPTDAVCWFVGDLQSLLLSDFGIIARGGIAVGPNYHDDSMIFGPALVEAHGLEHEVAVTPRTVLSESATSMVDRQVVPLVIDEDDGRPWLDYIRIGLPASAERQRSYLDRLRNGIVNGLTTSTDTPTSAKWEWTARYFNATATVIHPGVMPV